jgi:hypothetical protein
MVRITVDPHIAALMRATLAFASDQHEGLVFDLKPRNSQALVRPKPG